MKTLKCYICGSDFEKPITAYPDGKDPCPGCVKSYQERTEVAEEGEVETLPETGGDDEYPVWVTPSFPVDDDYE